LAISVFATVLTIYLIFVDGFTAAKYYILITGLAWGMYLIRKGIRKRLEKFESDKSEENKK